MTDMIPIEEKTTEGLVSVDGIALSGKQRGFAIAALVLGIISVFTLSGVLVLGILAISFAIASRDKVTKRMSRRAKAGLILGIVGIVLLVAGVGTFVGILFAFIKALEEGCAAAGDSISQSIADSLKGSFCIPTLF